MGVHVGIPCEWRCACSRPRTLREGDGHAQLATVSPSGRRPPQNLPLLRETTARPLEPPFFAQPKWDTKRSKARIPGFKRAKRDLNPL